MTAAVQQIGPRTAVAGWILAGAAVLLIPVVLIVVAAVGAESAGRRWTYLAMAAVVLVVVVVLPALLARSILGTRIEITGDTVTRLRSGHVVATMRMDEVEQVTVGWQTAPGVMRRRPALTLVGPTGGTARGIGANGIVLDDVTPLLDLVAAEVARRPDILVSDRAVFDEVLAERRGS